MKNNYRNILNKNKEFIKVKKNLNTEIQSMWKRFEVNKFNYKKLDGQYNSLHEEYKTTKKKYYVLQDKID